jgi:hypothetical protein
VRRSHIQINIKIIYNYVYTMLYFLFLFIPETLIEIMFLGSKVRLVRGDYKLTAIYEPIV